MEFAKAMPSAIRETDSASDTPLRPVRLGAPDAILDRRADGTIHIRAAQSLGNHHGILRLAKFDVVLSAAYTRRQAQKDAAYNDGFHSSFLMVGVSDALHRGWRARAVRPCR